MILSRDWFLTIYFDPKNGLLPELIKENGSRSSISEISKTSMLLDVLKNSILKSETRPFILYNGTHSVEHLKKLFVTNKHKKILQEQEIAFYFFEPLTHCLSPIGPVMPPHILRINNNPEEITKIRSLELNSISEWASTHDINNVIVYCTDHLCRDYYQQFYTNLTLMESDVFVSWLSEKKLSQVHERMPSFKTIKKKFWSGAWRYDASRHFITAYLANKDLTLTNNVSFFFKISNAEFKRRLWLGWREFEFRHPALSEKLINGNTKLQEQVPLSIEIDNTVILNEKQSDPEHDGNGKNIRKSHNPSDSYKESFCAIVLESRVTQPWPNISEKTLNAIQNYRPILMVGAPGTLKMLKDMGFKTFDKWWDESYDSIENNADRLAKICEVIDYIDSFTLRELKIMYKDMSSVLLHNEENIKNISKFYNKNNKRLRKQLKK